MSSARDRLEEFQDKAKEFGNQIEDVPKKKKHRDRLKRYKEKKKMAKIEEWKRQVHKPTEEFLLHVNIIKKQIVKLRKLVNEIRIQQGKTYIVPKLDDKEMSLLDSKCDEAYKQCYTIQSQIKELEVDTASAKGARHKICVMQSEFLIGQLKTVMDDFRLLQTGYVEKRKMDYRDNWIKNGKKTQNASEDDKIVEESAEEIELDQNRNSKKSKLKVGKMLTLKKSKSKSDQSYVDKTVHQATLPGIDEHENFVEERRNSDKSDNKVGSVEKGDKSSIRKRLSKHRKSITGFFEDGKQDSLSKEKSNPNLAEDTESSDDDIDFAFNRYSKSFTDADLNDEESTESNTLKRDKNRWSWRFGFKKIKSKTPERSLSQSSDQIEPVLGSHDDSQTIPNDSAVFDRTGNDPSPVENSTQDNMVIEETPAEVTYSEFKDSIEAEDSSTPNKKWSKKEKMKIPLLSSLRKRKPKKEKKGKGPTSVIKTDMDEKLQKQDCQEQRPGNDAEKSIEQNSVEIVTAKKEKIGSMNEDKGRQSETSQVRVAQLSQDPAKEEEEEIKDGDVFEEVDVPNKNWSRKEKTKNTLLSSLRKTKFARTEKIKLCDGSVENKKDNKTRSNDDNENSSVPVSILRINDTKESNATVSNDVKIQLFNEPEKASLVVGPPEKPRNQLSDSSLAEVGQVKMNDELKKTENSFTTSQGNALSMKKEGEVETAASSTFFSRANLFRFSSRRKKLSTSDDESKMIPLLEQPYSSESEHGDTVGNLSEKTIEGVPDVGFRGTGGQIFSQEIVKGETKKLPSEEINYKGDNSKMETEECQEFENSNAEDSLLIEIDTEKSREELEEIHKREQRLKVLENNIMDINVLQKEMYSIVESGENQINRIEHYVDAAEYNVEEGRMQLIEATKWSKRLRKRKAIIGVVVTVVLVVGLIILIVCLA